MNGFLNILLDSFLAVCGTAAIVAFVVLVAELAA